LRHFILKIIILPRQARDKRKEKLDNNPKNGRRFTQGGCDYVELFDGPDPNSPSLGKFSGQPAPSAMPSVVSRCERKGQKHLLNLIRRFANLSLAGWSAYKNACLPRQALDE
jgi:hypothetical protein